MSDTTPGAAALSHAMTQARTSAEEFARMFADMKFPAMPDSEALLTAYRRNMEVLAAANKVAMEGAQAVAQRNMEIMQQTVGELADSLRALSGGETPQAKAAKQAELLKRAYERAVAHTRELGDLIQTTNSEAVKLLNSRFTEAMDEVKTLVAKAGAPQV